MKIIKPRYLIEPRDRIYVKGYGFLSFAKNMGKILSNKYDQKLFDSAKKSTKTQLYRKDQFKKQQKQQVIWLVIKLLIINIASVSKKSSKKFLNDETQTDRYSSKDAGEAILKDVLKKRYISPEERQQIIDELRLV